MKYSWTSRKTWLRIGGYTAIFTAGVLMGNLSGVRTNALSAFIVVFIALFLWQTGMNIVDGQDEEKEA